MTDGDPQDYVELHGDDGVVRRVVIPRVWHLPSRPPEGTRLRDRYGLMWERREGVPAFVDLWHAEGMKILRWHELLGMRGPLTEVL